MIRQDRQHPLPSQERRADRPAGRAGALDDATLDGFFAELASRFEEALLRHAVPGGALALHYYGREWTGAFGVTNIAYPLPTHDETLFQVGGITRLVTALAVAILVEQGKLDWDEPVRAYLPTLRLADPRVAERVTARQLLNHTAGWYGDDRGGGESGPDAAARYLSRLASAPQLLPLGWRFSINDSAYVVAGRLLEVLTGQRYAAAVRDLIFEPLGMTRALFDPREVVTTRYAIGHALEGGRPKVEPTWTVVPPVLAPAGGLCASARDLLRLGRALKGSGTTLLSEESLAALHTPTTDPGVLEREELAGFGLGVMVWEGSGGRYFGQSGSTTWQHARLVYHPEADFVLVLLTNAAAGEQAIAEVLPFALERYTGIHAAPLSFAELPPSALDELTGRYGFADPRLGPLIAITLREDGLRFEYGGEARLAPLAPDVVVVADGPRRGQRAEFLRDSGGSVNWLRFGGKVYPRLR
ncbi:MAG: serine hydrolase domain-containing protein [Chloroflexota bacterium]|nr:beta-lactamase family protein [Dehalococcoidia bacterium]MDW8253822.1 serine hydrolase domain-containing protein [Chloroflexota bacterium]